MVNLELVKYRISKKFNKNKKFRLQTLYAIIIASNYLNFSITKKFKNVELVEVYSRNILNAKRLSKKFNISRYTDNLNKIFQSQIFVEFQKSY